MDDLASVWCEWAEMEIRHEYVTKRDKLKSWNGVVENGNYCVSVTSRLH